MIFQVIAVQIFFFIGLVLVLRKILISSSYNETKRLQQLSEENAQKTRELAAKISDAEGEYREKMARAETEVRRLKADARREAEELKAAIIAEGKAESGRLMKQAASARDELRLEIEEQMGERCAAFSRKMLREILSSEEQRLVYDGLLAGVFRELDTMEGDRLRGVDLGGAAGGTVAVKTSHSMSAPQKEKLETILSSKLGQRVSVQETVEKEMIAGIVITLGSFVIDGSLSGRFRKAAERLKNAN